MAELNVNKKTVRQLLSFDSLDTKGKKYIIPDYQRPYSWNYNKHCITLWEDLVNFYTEHKNDNEEYFLGSIVTCVDEDNSNNIDIIDGQQRITTFLLLLRAFYTKLEMMLIGDNDNKEVKGLMKSIEPCIWNINRMTQEISDKKDIHISSNVAIDKDIFEKILENGQVDKESKSKYAENYSKFFDWCNEYATFHTMDWKELCLCILDRCIILVIDCKNLNSALTIFGTLNDRGMNLADSDIFKSQLFKLQQTDEDKKRFTENWQNLEKILNEANLDFDDIFRFYSHVIRAKSGISTKEIGLRPFYAGDRNKYSIFKEDMELLQNLKLLAEFWKEANVPTEDSRNSDLAQKYLQILTTFPSDVWRYPVSVFFIKHKDDENFKEIFPDFLAKLLSFVLLRFIDRPTVAYVRDPLYKYCIDIYKTGFANFECDFPSDYENKFNELSSSRFARCILLLNTYLQNGNYIDYETQIEHILPKKWNNAYYNEFDSIEEAKPYIEMYGNKILFERILNIKAGDKYFAKKKENYSKSHNDEVKSLSTLPQDNWGKKDIEKRNKEIFERVTNFFKRNLRILLLSLTTLITFSCTDKEEACILDSRGIDGYYYSKVEELSTDGKRVYKVIRLPENSEYGLISMFYDIYRYEGVPDVYHYNEHYIINYDCNENSVTFGLNDTIYNITFLSHDDTIKGKYRDIWQIHDGFRYYTLKKHLEYYGRL